MKEKRAFEIARSLFKLNTGLAVTLSKDAGDDSTFEVYVDVSNKYSDSLKGIFNMLEERKFGYKLGDQGGLELIDETEEATKLGAS